MKLNNLTIAVLIALGTAACGGSGDAAKPPHVDPQPKPAPQPDNGKNQPGRDDKALVDPTNTHVVDNRDLSKESTVGGLQYIRRDGSGYDRANNPEQMASATPLLGVSLNEQNPKLTNIVLARRDLDYKDGEAVRAQFAGGTDVEPLTAAGKPREDDSLQVENFKNVDVLAGAFKQVGSAVFSDPNNRLNGTTHNIDTHIQNNTDKDGEFTRERVTHVYTPRYEYKQPYVDYPNIKEGIDPHDPSLVGMSATDPRLAPPTAPDLPSDIEKTLRDHPDWATEGEGRNYSRHPVNIGTHWDRVHPDTSYTNDKDKYGNMGDPQNINDPSGNFRAKVWRNDPSGNATTAGRDGRQYNTGNLRQTNTVDWTSPFGAEYGEEPGEETKRYQKGRTPAFGGSSIGYDAAQAAGYTTAKAPNYHQPYPNGAYPRFSKDNFGYPNNKYDEYNNNTLNTTDGRKPHDHEHIYLEREEFTAIRQWNPIRPLVNPVANEWKWTLKQEWKYEKIEQTRTQEVPDPLPGDPNHKKTVPVYEWVTYNDDPASNGTKKRADRYNGNGNLYEGGNLSDNVGKTRNWSLHNAYWTNPQNEGKGHPGEFRGRSYIGWKEDDRVIRFADNRIWKPGTPGYKPEYENKYGANLIWWSTQDSAFENWATSEGWNPRARRVDINTDHSACGTIGTGCGEGTEDLVWGKNTKPHGTNARDRDVEIQPTGDITNGLIRIGGYPDGRDGQPKPEKMKTLGEELTFDGARWNDHHKTTTRIFGHYHLAYADQDDRSVKAMSMNSYSGARSFVSQVEGTLATPTAQGYRADLDSKPTQYSLGAKPITLKKVQYGRVTTNLDLTASGTKLLPNGFLRAPFEKKGTGDSVDNYFFRGVDETTIEQMNALPSNQVARYEGHALMYGIDNSFHGIRTNRSQKDLPNAFDGTGGQNATAHTLGLGNFVEAEVNFGTKKVTGDVYNAWLEQLDKPGVYKDKLVTFSGDVIGNTVIGKADRTYAPGNDEADFRAAFYGSQADEMGGSFNSVKATNKYGSAYEVGDWGGVFGATKVGTNTFQGDDGGQNYGGGSAPAQTPNVADRYAP